MKKIYRLILCTILLLTTACQQNDILYTTQIQPSHAAGFAASARPWTSLEALDQQARFHFVVVTDRTGGEREGVFAAAMSGIDLMQPAFVVSVGDLIKGYTRNHARLTAKVVCRPRWRLILPVLACCKSNGRSLRLNDPLFDKFFVKL